MYQSSTQDINNYKINNIQPRTRQEREALKNKEVIEKTRINQRVGYETRNIDMRDLIHNADPRSDLYCPENVRFDKDFATYDKQRRESEYNNKQEALENKRAAHLNRESEKWMKMDKEFDHANEILQRRKKLLSDVGTYSNGMAFNPITLEYHQSVKGEQLRQRDEKSKFKAKLRAKNLDYRANTDYNILTGEQRVGVDVPKDVFMRFAKDIIVPRKKRNNIW